MNKFFVTLFIFSIILILGWFFNIYHITSISEDFVSTKISTAVCLLLTSITGLLHNKKYDVNICIAYTIILIMSFSIGTAVGNYGMPQLDNENPAYSIAPAVPSVFTTACFFYICTLVWVNPDNNIVYGSILIIIQIIPIIGHIFSLPLLYFYIPNFSTGIAIPTIIGFILFGLGVLFNKKDIKCL